MPTRKIPAAVLISGGGSTLKNLIEQADSGALDLDIRLVISSREQAGGLQFARDAGIPFHVVRRRDHAEIQTFCEANFNLIRQAECELVIMGGYLSLLPIPEDYRNRVINIHPSLIPAFSGQGYYGLAVHRAAIEYGVKVSGCTVHFVDNQFDHGPIIAQEVCPVEASDTAEDLQARVGVLERKLLPRVVQAIAEQRIQVDDQKRTVSWS